MSDIDENGEYDKPPIQGATWVEDYERSTGHVCGYWKTSDGHRIDNVEVDSEGVTLRILNKKDDVKPGKFSGLSENELHELAETSDDLEALSTLANDSRFEVRKLVARNENTPVSLLERLAGDKSDFVRGEVAKNKNTPATILEKMANDKDNFVRKEVARNENTPPAKLEKLVEDRDYTMRSNVAFNKNTPVAVLEGLAYDDNWEVRYWLTENSSTPTTTLKKLTTDKETWVRDEAIYHLSDRQKSDS